MSVVKALRSKPVSTHRGFVMSTCSPFLTRLVMDEKELQIETPEEQDNEPLLGQISFEELLAEIRL